MAPYSKWARPKMRGVTAYTLGVLVAYIVGSVIGTQMILYSVSTMALEVTINARFASTVDDLIGLSSSLLPIMAVSLAAPWLACDFVTRRHPHLRSPLLYGLTAAFAGRDTAYGAEPDLWDGCLCARQNATGFIRPMPRGRNRRRLPQRVALKRAASSLKIKSKADGRAMLFQVEFKSIGSVTVVVVKVEISIAE